MPFDDPIYLDRDSFEELMVDTDEHRLCWMYHDLLSSARIAWLLDESAGKGSDVHESWASMAWVAAGHQPGSFYLLYKWYEYSLCLLLYSQTSYILFLLSISTYSFLL